MQWVLQDPFNVQYMYWVYWSLWFVTTALLVYAIRKNSPIAFRILLQMVMIRNILPFINIEEKRHKNLMNFVSWIQMQVPYVIFIEMVVIITEPIQISPIYSLVIDVVYNYRIIAMVSGWPDTNKYSVNNIQDLNYITFVGLTVGAFVWKFVTMVAYIYIRTKNLQCYNKFQLQHQNFKVIINTLN